MNFKFIVTVLVLAFSLASSQTVLPANAFNFCESPSVASFENLDSLSNSSSSIKSYARSTFSKFFGTKKPSSPTAEELRLAALEKEQEAARQAELRRVRLAELENERRIKEEKKQKFWKGVGTVLTIAGAVAEGYNRSKNSGATNTNRNSNGTTSNNTCKNGEDPKTGCGELASGARF